ncbi:MAG: transcription termination/antitermination protein NusG [Longimicrobiales bacterium]
MLAKAERSIPAALYREPRWYACYTRARAEKKTAEVLARRGFEAYLPLVARERQWQDRRKVVEFPAFPSYVFLRFRLTELHEVIRTPGVSTVVRVRGYPTPIADEEVENIRRFVQALPASGVVADSRPFLAEGQWVRVREGPLEGVKGVIAERRSRTRFLVGLSTIGQGLEVDMDGRVLEPIRGPWN